MTAGAPTGGEAVSAALEGLGGAPGRPGTVYVVGVPADVQRTTARAAVLLASADRVVTDGDPRDPVLRLAGDAEVVARPVGSPPAPDGRVVVRLVRTLPVHRVPGLVDELAALDRAGVPFEVEPLPEGGHGVPTVVTAWRDRLPLRGRRVLVPRTRAQASALSMHVRSLGGEPVEAPTIEVRPGDHDRLVEAVGELAGGAYAGLCLTSPNGVDALADAIDAGGRDSRILAAVALVACVGPGTAGRLRERCNVVADLVPDVATTAGLASAIPAGTGRVLLPRADIATNELREGLVSKGYDPVEIAAYRTVRPAALPPDVLDDLAAGRIDLLAFASSSTVRNFVALLEDRPVTGLVVSIGPVTSRTATELGLGVAVEADPHTLDGLVAALCRAASAGTAGTGPPRR